jgi:hypothetical protein
MTTLKTGSTLTSGTGAGDTATALTITFNASHPLGQQGFQSTDYINAPIFTIPDGPAGNVKAVCYGDFVGARRSLLDTGTMRADGRSGRDPACFLFPDGTAAAGIRWWSGTGVPSATTIGGAATLGDIYTRIDGAGGSYVYRCTVSGTPGTWAAVL